MVSNHLHNMPEELNLSFKKTKRAIPLLLDKGESRCTYGRIEVMSKGRTI